MRLIDAEPIEKAIDEWLARETKDPVTLTIVDNVGTWVTHAPTVEAIPIDFLIKTQDEYCERYGPVHEIVVKNLIQDWRKENETD